MYIFTLFILRPTIGQVRHKAFFKVDLDTEPQPTRVQQNPKIPSAPSAFPQWGRPWRQETKHLLKSSATSRMPHKVFF